MKRKKALLLFNGSAGTGKIGKNAYQIVSAFAAEGYEPVVYPVLPERHIGAEEILREAGEDCALVVCGGGDGTLHHTIAALMTLDEKKRPALGYIPAGSTNDFAKGLRIPTDIRRACEAILQGTELACDVGSFNGKYFTYVAAFGAFSGVSYTTDQSFKNVLGHAAYVLSALAAIPENIGFERHMVVETDDGEREEGDYLFGAVCNAASLGGFRLPKAMRARFDDGLLELLLIKAPANAAEIPEILAALTGNDITKSPFIHVRRISGARFLFGDKTAWTLDGEYGGEVKRAQVRCVRGALSIRAPKGT